MKKIALLGPAYAEYPESVGKKINQVKQKEGTGKALSLWSYTHDQDMLKLLYNQVENIGYFNLYVYSTKNPRKTWSRSGSGKVDYKFKIFDFEYYDNIQITPNSNYSFDDGISNEHEERSKGWYWVEEIKRIFPKTWQSFREYQTGKSVGKPVGGMHLPYHRWKYVIDD